MTNRLVVTSIEMKIGFINKLYPHDQGRIQEVLSNVQKLFVHLADDKDLTNVSVSIEDQGTEISTMHIRATVEDAWTPTYIGPPQDSSDG